MAKLPPTPLAEETWKSEPLTEDRGNSRRILKSRLQSKCPFEGDEHNRLERNRFASFIKVFRCKHFFQRIYLELALLVEVSIQNTRIAMQKNGKEHALLKSMGACSPECCNAHCPPCTRFSFPSPPPWAAGNLDVIELVHLGDNIFFCALRPVVFFYQGCISG